MDEFLKYAFIYLCFDGNFDQNFFPHYGSVLKNYRCSEEYGCEETDGKRERNYSLCPEIMCTFALVVVRETGALIRCTRALCFRTTTRANVYIIFG
jgi:hypothetical protein